MERMAEPCNPSVALRLRVRKVPSTEYDQETDYSDRFVWICQSPPDGGLRIEIRLHIFLPHHFQIPVNQSYILRY